MSLKCFLVLALLSTLASCLLVPIKIESLTIKLTVSVLEIDVSDLDQGLVKSFTKNPQLSDTIPFGLLPYDDGSSNFGDLIHLRRGRKDECVFKEVLTNDPGSDSPGNFQWAVSIPGYEITHVRMFNVGRQRAFCCFIASGGSSAQAGIYVPPNVSYRLYIDVYARRI